MRSCTIHLAYHYSCTSFVSNEGRGGGGDLASENRVMSNKMIIRVKYKV